MASAPLPPPLRGGREGAGRGGGPASWAVLRWALASSCLCCECGGGSEWVSTRWNAHCCCPLDPGRVLPVPLPPRVQPGASGQPLPRPVSVTVAAEMWGWPVGHRAPAWPVLYPDHIPPILVLGALLRFWAWQPLPHWAGSSQGYRVRLSIF